MIADTHSTSARYTGTGRTQAASRTSVAGWERKPEITGDTQAAFLNVASTAAMVRAGKLKPLALANHERLPEGTSSVVTCIDGHQMARQGRAGAALAVAALGSFFAGCVSTALIAACAPPLALVGQSFGAPEYFPLMLFGLIAAVVLAHSSVIKAVAMIVLGLLVGLVGTDGQTGGTRFTSAASASTP